MATIITYINSIALDYATAVPRTREFEITTEAVQSSEFDDVTRHVKTVLPEFGLRCAFTGDDRETNFQSILDLADEKSLVTLTQLKTYENLVIKEVRETGTYTDTVEFIIRFRQVNTVTFETTDVPLEAKTQEVQDTSSKGLQSTTEVSIDIPDYPTTISE